MVMDETQTAKERSGGIERSELPGLGDAGAQGAGGCSRSCARVAGSV